jgi:two-component system CheB/CheR fusion protein
LGFAVDIVEDDDAVRDSIGALLESYGYSVSQYASAAQYLQSGTRHGVCLIVDQHMPGKTGLELLEALRGRGDNVPAIMLTGRSDPQMEPRMVRAKVSKLLHKPVNDAELVRAIEDVSKEAI